MIDYSAEDRQDYIKQSFVLFGQDTLLDGQGVGRETSLRFNEAVFEDNLYNPLDSVTDQFNFLQVNPALTKLEPLKELDVQHYVILDSDMNDLKRVRYNFWDALGDVGGFHDGLVLLIRIVIGPFAAHGFFLELLAKQRKEPIQTRQHMRERKMFVQSLASASHLSESQ